MNKHSWIREFNLRIKNVEGYRERLTEYFLDMYLYHKMKHRRQIAKHGFKGAHQYTVEELHDTLTFWQYSELVKMVEEEIIELRG